MKIFTKEEMEQPGWFENVVIKRAHELKEQGKIKRVHTSACSEIEDENLEYLYILGNNEVYIPTFFVKCESLVALLNTGIPVK